jgi:ABC-2 type transport system ATP-binding protein
LTDGLAYQLIHNSTLALALNKIFNMNPSPVIEVQNVSKSFKSVKAVRDLSFTVGAGKFLALLGPNGAGKTTMVEMIEGIQKPDHGKIFITGKKWTDHKDEIHRIIGLSLQETQFMDKLTVVETLWLFASFYDLGRNRVNEVIDIVGLEEKRKAFVVNLSGGQRQRMALGIALLNKPKVLLLDEPTTGLDPNARREVWSILGRLKNETGTSLILTTHYMEEAEQLCDYIIIMDHGVILREGTLEQLLKNDRDKKIVEFTLKEIPTSPDIFINHSPFNIEWNRELKKGTLELKNFESELPVFFQFLKEKNLVLDDMISRRITLDDLFISLTGRHLHA